MTDLSRPESLDFPKVWRTFEGKKTINGIKRKYWIQDVTDDYREEVLYYMTTGFIGEEPLTKYSNFADDPQSLEDILVEWKKLLDEKLSLICLTKDENDKTHFVGCNVLGLTRKSDKKSSFKGKNSTIVFGSVFHLYGIKDIFSVINADAFLNALGLYVLPDYRGEGIGTQLLKARRELSLAVGLKASITVFTSNGGQKTAEVAGFKNLVDFPFANLEEINPLFKLPGIENDPTKSMKLMYITYSD